MTDIKRTLMGDRDNPRMTSSEAMKRIARACGALRIDDIKNASDEQRELILEHGIAGTLPPMPTNQRFGIAPSGTSLAGLAEYINRFQGIIIGHQGELMVVAAETGAMLNRAKEKVNHGEWEAWVATNLTIKSAQATRYMRLGANMPLLAKLALTQDFPSIDSAYTAVGKSLKGENPKPVKKEKKTASYSEHIGFEDAEIIPPDDPEAVEVSLVDGEVVEDPSQAMYEFYRDDLVDTLGKIREQYPEHCDEVFGIVIDELYDGDKIILSQEAALEYLNMKAKELGMLSGEEA